jgi:geranylgeranyl transferase type-1 subunit beta
MQLALSLAIIDAGADPYHTYLSIAAAAIVSPDPAWGLQPLDPLINATPETARWAKEHVSEPER